MKIGDLALKTFINITAGVILTLVFIYDRFAEARTDGYGEIDPDDDAPDSRD